MQQVVLPGRARRPAAGAAEHTFFNNAKIVKNC